MTNAVGAWDVALWNKTRIEWKQVWGGTHFSIGCQAVATDFSPGQFAQVGLTLEGGETLIRPLSLVNLPHKPYEFYVCAQPDGLFSNRLHQLEVGAPLWIHRSFFGHLSLKSLKKCRNLYLISTGTGLSPYLSFLRERRLQTLAEKIFFIHGVRSASELAYHSELREHFIQYGSKLKFILSITSEKSWNQYALTRAELFKASEPIRDPLFQTLYAGRIPEMLSTKEEELFQSFPAFSANEDVVFLCGNREMVRALRQWLVTEKGFKHYSPESQSGLFLEGY